MVAQKRVIDIIKRPTDIDVKYTFEISTYPQTAPRNYVFSDKCDALLEFWWPGWKNCRILKVKNFISVDFQTQVSLSLFNQDENLHQNHQWKMEGAKVP